MADSYLIFAMFLALSLNHRRSLQFRVYNQRPPAESGITLINGGLPTYCDNCNVRFTRKKALVLLTGTVSV